MNGNTEFNIIDLIFSDVQTAPTDKFNTSEQFDVFGFLLPVRNIL